MAKIHELYNRFIESNKKDTEFLSFLEDPKNAEFINSQECEDNCTVLHLAVLKGDVDTVKLLLKKQANADLRDNDNFKPIKYCLKGPAINQLIFDEFIKFNPALAADVNEKDMFGRTELHTAVLSNDLNKTESLLNINADVNVPDLQGLTAIGLAIARTEFGETILELLLRKSHFVVLHTPVLDYEGINTEMPFIPGLTDGVIVIGSTHIDPEDDEKKPVNRTMTAYRNAITNVKEFEEAVKAGAKFNYTQLELEIKRLLEKEEGNVELLQFYVLVKKHKELYDHARVDVHALLNKVREKSNNIVKENAKQNTATAYEKKHLLLQQATDIYNALVEAGEIRALQLLHDIYLTTAIIDVEEGNIDAFVDLYMTYFRQHPANEVSLRLAEIIAGHDFSSSALLNNQNKWQLILFLLNGIDTADAERLRANALAIVKQTPLAATEAPNVIPIPGKNIEKTAGIAGSFSYNEIAGAGQIISFIDAKAVAKKLEQERVRPDDELIKMINGSKLVIAEQLVLSPNNIQPLTVTEGKLIIDESLPHRFAYQQEALLMKFHADFICDQLQALITVYASLNPPINYENSNKDNKESKHSKKSKKDSHKSKESKESKGNKEEKSKKIKKERHSDRESTTIKEPNVSCRSCENKETAALRDKLNVLLRKALEFASIARQGIATVYVDPFPIATVTSNINNATELNNDSTVNKASMETRAKNVANPVDTAKEKNANTEMTANMTANTDELAKTNNATTASKYMKQLQEINEITQSCSQVFICLTDYLNNPQEPHTQETLQQACLQLEELLAPKAPNNSQELHTQQALAYLQLEELLTPKAPKQLWPKGAASKSTFFTAHEKPASSTSALPVEDLNLLLKLSQEWLTAAQALRASFSQTARLR